MERKPLLRMAEKSNNKKNFGLVENDIYNYLLKLKKHNQRGRTIGEITLKFGGLLSERTVMRNVKNLKKKKFLEEKIIFYDKNKKIKIYEAK